VGSATILLAKSIKIGSLKGSPDCEQQNAEDGRVISDEGAKTKYKDVIRLVGLLMR